MPFDQQELRRARGRPHWRIGQPAPGKHLSRHRAARAL